MIFAWFRRRRRLKLLAVPFPPAWLEILQRNVWQYALLSTDEQRRLCDIVRILVAEKSWEGCGGLDMTDEIRVTVAGLAGLLLLELNHDYYPQVLSILVYPTRYLVPQKRVSGDGVVHEVEDERLGEAWYRGPVILSWDDVRAGGRMESGGQNVVLHEFAHQLDMEDREMDGMPPLASQRERQQWQTVMSFEYQQLRRASEQGRVTLLDQYGTKDPMEFFAVATECFFERSRQLRARHPELYDTLRMYFHQDPATWKHP